MGSPVLRNNRCAIQFASAAAGFSSAINAAIFRRSKAVNLMVFVPARCLVVLVAVFMCCLVCCRALSGHGDGKLVADFNRPASGWIRVCYFSSRPGLPPSSGQRRQPWRTMAGLSRCSFLGFLQFLRPTAESFKAVVVSHAIHRQSSAPVPQDDVIFAVNHLQSARRG